MKLLCLLKKELKNEAMTVEKGVRKWLTLILVANGLNHLFSDEYKQICLLVSEDGLLSEG